MSRPSLNRGARREINRRQMRFVTGPDEWGSVYVYFRPRGTKADKTIKISDSAHADYDVRGRLIGIEILDVPWRKP